MAFNQGHAKIQKGSYNKLLGSNHTLTLTWEHDRIAEKAVWWEYVQ